MSGALGVLAAAAPEAAGSAGGSTGGAVAFWICGIVAVIAAIGMVFSRRAVYCALMLAVVMLCLAALYAVQDAPFLAFVQVIVYTGAIMMLFLFVLMLVGVDSSDSLVETIRGQRAWAALAGVGFAVLLAGGLGGAVTRQATGLAQANSGGNVQALARLMFTDYVYAFEATAALLITAALGAIVLTHQESLRPRVTQKEMSKRRFQGPRPSPLPNPGVYARHNAVDMPALLPDGSAAPGSVSEVIVTRRGWEGGSGELPERERVAVPPADRDELDLPSGAGTPSGADRNGKAPDGHGPDDREEGDGQ